MWKKRRVEMGRRRKRAEKERQEVRKEKRGMKGTTIARSVDSMRLSIIGTPRSR
jgi:hypothetical protein